MKKSPSTETNIHSVSQEIPRLLWNPPLVPTHTFPPYFRKVHTNIILPSMPRSSEWSYPFRFSDQNLVFTPYFFHARYMPAHFILQQLYGPFVKCHSTRTQHSRFPVSSLSSCLNGFKRNISDVITPQCAYIKGVVLLLFQYCFREL
jgi:hypothetical protein